MSSRKVKAKRAPRPIPRPEPAPEPAGFFDFGPEVTDRLSETLRKLALGLTVALIAARAYFPSEARSESETGHGLTWDLTILIAAGVAVAAAWISGKTRLRFSRADVGVLALIGLVCFSSRLAAEKRIALNLAWEWAGLGVAYFLLRFLPRTRGESSAIAGVLVATAVAVSAYGLYQVAVEFPMLRAAFRQNPIPMLREAGVDPADRVARFGFENRLLGSKEPMSTFALTNSLAGYLVGASALAFAVLLDRAVRGGRGRWRSILLAVPPLLVLVACLLLTKSRSAYLGLVVACLVVAWRARRSLPARKIAIGAAGIAAILAILIGSAAALKQLDLQVLTQSPKSLGYRLEYWKGAWGVINESSSTFWNGHAPGNFSGPYLLHKLPRASEEIADPHDLFLDVWATAGLPALLALVAAILFGIRDILGPPRPGPEDAAPPIEPPGWGGLGIAALGGIGGLLIVVPLGELDPLRQGDLIARWLMLAAGWIVAVAFGSSIWRRGGIPAIGLGAGFLAVAINLVAAGGIGLPSVALMLWSLLALGLNLRDDRPCGRIRFDGGRWLAFALAIAFSMGLGTFAGQIGPFWRAEARMAEADRLLAGRPPDFEGAQTAYIEASKADPLQMTPHLSLADSTFVAWRDLKSVPGDAAWNQIDQDFKNALAPPRNPRNLGVYRRRATYAGAILARGDVNARVQVERLLKARADACSAAVKLYPNSPSLRADLTDALAARGQFGEAAEAARIALELDRGMPHAEKKLPPAVRKRLEESIPEWLGQKPAAIGPKPAAK